MSGPAELGRKGLPQADLLSAPPERRPLRGVGAAAGDRARYSRGLGATPQIDLTFARSSRPDARLVQITAVDPIADMKTQVRQAESSYSLPVRPCRGSGPGSRPAAT